MFSYSFLSPVRTNPTVWVDYDIGVSGSIVILALLPHISKCYAGVLSIVVKGRIDKEVTDSECMYINFFVLLQSIPDIYRVILLLKPAKEPERKAVGIYLHVIFD